MVLVRTVDGCAGGKFACTRTAFLSCRRRAHETARLARAAFATCAAATAVPAAAATSAAATPLAALSVPLATLADELTLLATAFGVGARLARSDGRRSAHLRLSGTRAGIPIPLTPFLVPVVVLTTTAIAPIVAASLAAPFGPPAVAVTAALTAI